VAFDWEGERYMPRPHLHQQHVMVQLRYASGLGRAVCLLFRMENAVDGMAVSILAA
jgi:hypothetical protein